MNKAHTIIHHNYCSIHNDSKIKSTEAHEIAGNSEWLHNQKGCKKREWNRECCNEGSANISEKNKQNQRHKRSAHNKVMLNCAKSCIYKVRAIVDRSKLRLFGKSFSNFF